MLILIKLTHIVIMKYNKTNKIIDFDCYLDAFNDKTLLDDKFTL